mmetsp:Transcript_30779/g.44780  ORF Transcript_30779/g.44780 Transcript_30779/m.44780 type:complete len:215 (-) Transcript_30779:289-933(-)
MDMKKNWTLNHLKLYPRRHDKSPPTRSAKKTHAKEQLSSKKRTFSPFPSTPLRSYDNEDQPSSYKKKQAPAINISITDEAHISVTLNLNQRDEPINSRFPTAVNATIPTTRNDKNPILYKKQQASYFPTSTHSMDHQYQMKMSPQPPIVSQSFYSRASNQNKSLIGGVPSQLSILTPRGNRLPLTSPAGGSVYSQKSIRSKTSPRTDALPPCSG